MGTGSSKYRLGARLGGGGMAEVFRATKIGVEGFSRAVAVKRMLPTLSADASFAEMFKNEARLASLLAHPNIVAVDDFDRDAEGRLFLAMELVEGRDLRQLQETGRLPVAASAYIIAQVLGALSYAHELTQQGRPLGMVHRDVSPHNVLISWDGAVKLSDFGIAKAMGASGASRTGTLKGKVGYMSPEQAHGVTLDGRSDVFAVGVMFHELLTGERLFAGATEAEVLSRMLAQPIASPRERNPEVSEDVAAVCLGMLERDRERRFAGARPALEALLNSDVVSARGQTELAKLMQVRFSEQAPPRADDARPAAALGGAGATAPLQARDRELAAAMDAPTRTEAPGHTTGTPTAAGEARPAVSATAPGPRKRGGVGIAIAALAAAAAGAAAVAFAMGAFDRGGDEAAGIAAAPRDVVAAPPDAGAPRAAVAADAGAPRAAMAPDAAVERVVRADVADRKRDRKRNRDRRRKRDRDRDRAAARDEVPDRTPEPPRDDPPKVDRAPRGEGVLQVRVQPWANATVAGHGTKTTPANWKLPAGRYKVTLSNEERNKKTTITVVVEPDGVKTISRDWTK